MKLAILSDTQYGIKQNYVPYLELNRRFLNEIFWPELEKRDIKSIIHLGDIVEHRRYINFLTAKYLKEDFFDHIVHGGYYLHWIFGNHDIYYRETHELGAADILGPNCIYRYSRASNVRFDGCDILFVPWIVEENRDHTLQTIRTSPASVVFGHLELQGHQLDKHQTCHTGIAPSLFTHFELVLTGHFHHRSIRDNIYYVGSHAEFTWSDYGDKHGFHIFDTDTRDVEFIENPFKVFHEIVFDGKTFLTPPEEAHQRITRVIVQAKPDAQAFDQAMQAIYQAKPLEVECIDTYLSACGPASKVGEVQDTETIIREAVAAANTKVDAMKLDALMMDLYKEAQLL